jgi:acetylornithine deacetylase
MVRLAMPENVTQLLQGMVRIDSVNSALSGRAHAEDQLRDWLEDVATAFGLATRKLVTPGHADQLLVMHAVSADRPWLLFDSHLDTVDAAGMTIEPFGGVIDGDRLLGRGACDTKGTGAAMLWALRDYAAGDHQPNNIALLFSVDEEVGMVGVRAFLERDLPTLPFRPAAVFVGEPTDCHPVVAHNGTVRWSITTHGKAAHSSVPHEGASAISSMMRVVDAIESRYCNTLSAEHPLTGRAACSINLISGGTAINIIPASCTIELDRRLVPGEKASAALAAVDETLRPLGVSYTMKPDVIHPPLSDDGNRAVAAAAKSVLADMGLPTMVIGAPFATHAAYFAQAGLPTIVIGPGEPWSAHTREEFVHVSKIIRGVELYRRLMAIPATDQGPDVEASADPPAARQ